MVMRYANVSDLNEAVKVVDGKMFVGDKEVQGAEDYLNVHEGKVPTLLLVRYKSHYFGSPTWNLVTGLDLIGKQIWLGGVNLNWHINGQRQSFPSASFQWWEQVKGILDNQCSDTAGKEWGIFTEDCYATPEEEAKERAIDDAYWDRYED